MRNGVDLALIVLGGSQRSAVVEICPAVPRAVPGVRLQSDTQLLGSLPAPIGIVGLAAPLSHFCKRVQHADEEPAVPDALALSVGADLIHAVVPIAGAHQGQSVGTQPIAVLQGANAVLVNGAGLLTHGGQVEVFLLLFAKYRRRDERHDLI